jgi:hypothetical protein
MFVEHSNASAQHIIVHCSACECKDTTAHWNCVRNCNNLYLPTAHTWTNTERAPARVMDAELAAEISRRRLLVCSTTYTFVKTMYTFEIVCAAWLLLQSASWSLQERTGALCSSNTVLSYLQCIYDLQRSLSLLDSTHILFSKVKSLQLEQLLLHYCYCANLRLWLLAHIQQVCAAAYAVYGQSAASDVSADAVTVAHKQGMQLQSLELATAAAVQCALRGDALTDNTAGMTLWTNLSISVF